VAASAWPGSSRSAENSGQARIAITFDLEMSRNFPRWEDAHWDYEKGNLDAATKEYALRAGERVKQRGGRIHYFCVGRVLEQPDVTVDEEETAVWLLLVDGSRVQGRSFSVGPDMAHIRLDEDRQFEIPTRWIEWVRFHAPTDQLENQWERAIGHEVLGDRLVVRRSPESLNHLEGLIHSVDDDTVAFHFNGQDLDAPRARLEGLVFFHATVPNYGDPVCSVRDTSGSTWQVTQFSLDEEGLQLTAPTGLQFTLPLERVVQLDFSAGNLVFLSDLEPQSVHWTPYFDSPLDSDRLNQMFAPKRNRSFDGGPLRLHIDGRTQVFEKGWALRSRSELVYRLTEDYSKLKAIVGIDERVGSAGDVELVISGGDRELLRRRVRGEEDPSTIELDISGVRRLRILVDYGDNLDIADHLNLCNVMLIQ
jgi:hypothetical protein